MTLGTSFVRLFRNRNDSILYAVVSGDHVYTIARWMAGQPETQNIANYYFTSGSGREMSENAAIRAAQDLADQ